MEDSCFKKKHIKVAFNLSEDSQREASFYFHVLKITTFKSIFNIICYYFFPFHSLNSMFILLFLCTTLK